jgi:DNA (cytosine-5)-methyltransferase 1
MIRPEELLVDNFAGGGGASCGIEAALGRHVDIAINHSPAAIAMHRANHPRTKHYCESVWDVDPAEVCAGRPVGLVHLSPDCTHFSKAKGGKPVSRRIRGLAWLAVRWAKSVRPRVIVLENVEEFTTWGPLNADGKPDRSRNGRTFQRFVAKLRAYGYVVDWRILVAADFGAPTTRRRLFMVARCDGHSIVWPEPSHGRGHARPWRTAAEVIDWSLPVRSIFGRKKPLADATLRRIAAGVKRFVIESPRPFIAPVMHQGDQRTHDVAEPVRTVTAANRGELALVAAFMAKHYGGVVGHGVQLPLGTVTSVDHHSLAVAHLTKFYGTAGAGADVREPMPTVTANDRGGGHLAEVRAFLVKYYGASPASQQQSLLEPLHTVTSRARFGLVTIEGHDYQIVDVGMRILSPRELFAAQGFPPDYVIDAPIEPSGNRRARTLTKTAQIECAGNSVCLAVEEAVVAANFGRRFAEVA